MKKFDFKMGALDYFVHGIVMALLAILSIFTLFIALPWVLAYHYRWYYSFVTLDGKKLEYHATGLEILIETIIIALLTIITLGIYSFWAYPRFQRFQWTHIRVEGDINEQDLYPNNTPRTKPQVTGPNASTRNERIEELRELDLLNDNNEGET